VCVCVRACSLLCVWCVWWWWWCVCDVWDACGVCDVFDMCRVVCAVWRAWFVWVVQHDCVLSVWWVTQMHNTRDTTRCTQPPQHKQSCTKHDTPNPHIAPQHTHTPHTDSRTDTIIITHWHHTHNTIPHHLTTCAMPHAQHTYNISHTTRSCITTQQSLSHNHSHLVVTSQHYRFITVIITSSHPVRVRAIWHLWRCWRFKRFVCFFVG
jgi:hypothetical protein